MRRILIVSVALLFSMACGEDSQDRPNETNNAATNNATTNVATNNSTNNVSPNGISDDTLMSELDEAEFEILFDEYLAYRTLDEVKARCLALALGNIFGQYVGDDEFVKYICTSEQAECVRDYHRLTKMNVREGCEATVGEWRACQRSDVEQIAEYSPKLIQCDDLTEENLEEIDKYVDALPQTEACIHYKEVCP